jgi:hypothetical protein
MRKKSKNNIKSTKTKNSYIYESKQPELVVYQNSNTDYPNVLQYVEIELGINIST